MMIFGNLTIITLLTLLTQIFKMAVKKTAAKGFE